MHLIGTHLFEFDFLPKYFLIVIGSWVAIGSNFFIHAVGGETAPFSRSIRESLGETTPADFEGNKFTKLWSVFKIIFILSHGEASVERGFSINKNIEVENLNRGSYGSQRIVYDHVKQSGGIHLINITKELRISATSAHSKYRLFFEEQRAKEIAANDTKKKLESNFLITLWKKKSLLEKEIAEMECKANELAEQARDFSPLTKI
ncbi:hypothetical protein AVEN_115745-1 [Araneus ventricosus]|uniref:Uncharacterized protein n=1 Tax=Araneus ventricosus TaxID=182803 RepID=A0A4Y2LJN8_ARAVE|nr:hypothetical protein AVEN_115745-1 [Araneus ventricosus]